VVTRVSGRLMTIRWETGEESTLSPGPGVLRVVGRGRAKAPARQPATTTSARSKTATKPSSQTKKATSSTKTGAKETGAKSRTR
jgi:hypothetical protein